MNTGEGNPAPAAFFNGTPAVQNYDVTMKSISLPGLPWVCANVYLEFDYMLTDIAAGGTEKLIVSYFIDNIWFPAVEIKNEGSTGWVHQKIDISQVCGKWFRLGFKAMGSNSANITSWAVDNIKVTPECKGPAACDYTRSGNIVHLFWQHPQCDSLLYIIGYNVYRTDEDGLPPFNKLNTAPITDVEYFDHFPPAITSAHFRYIITDIQKDPASNTILCEAPCDTLLVDVISGLPKHDNTGLQISPNPAADFIRVQSDLQITSCELLDCTGQRILTVPAEKQKSLKIPVSGLPSGIYLIRIKNASGTVVRKVAVMH
jgi:hypothetical protein